MEGFLDRRVDRLPDYECEIFIVNFSLYEESILKCKWIPYKKEYFNGNLLQPIDGYLGTAKKLEEPYKGIGFHAFIENDSEFVYYKLVNYE